MLQISVIICTHNPRPDYLRRVLDALKGQTLPVEQWELLLIDNVSKEKLADSWDLTWHPHGRHIREDELGLTPARIRGIKEATGALLVFVDDDNVLNADYLAECCRIAVEYSFLGVWGGQQTGEFEGEAPEYLKPYLGNIACRVVEKNTWSNLPFCYEATPVGAGLCIRKHIAMTYLEITGASQLSKKLDRVGTQLTSCGDHDLAFTACDVGSGMGVFTTLKLTHLIPKGRMQREYILRLMEGDAYSTALLRHRRGFPVHGLPKPTLRSRIRRKIRDLVRGENFYFLIQDARGRGLQRALNEIKGLPASPGK